MNPEYAAGPSRKPPTNVYFGVSDAADQGEYADIRLPGASDDSNRDSYVSVSPDGLLPAADGVGGSLKPGYESLDRSGHQTVVAAASNPYDELQFNSKV